MSPLSKERTGQIAMMVLQSVLEESGKLTLDPGSVKRNILNSSRKYGISPLEGAQFLKKVIEEAYHNTMVEIDDFLIQNPSDKVAGH